MKEHSLLTLCSPCHPVTAKHTVPTAVQQTVIKTCQKHSGELQEVVRATREGKLDRSNEDDLWSGRIWTGRQAAKLGLIDHVGTLESVCKQKYGEKVRCRVSPWHSCG